eukprot:scpid40959/ scgid4290/ 
MCADHRAAKWRRQNQSWPISTCVDGDRLYPPPCKLSSPGRYIYRPVMLLLGAVSSLCPEDGCACCSVPVWKRRADACARGQYHNVVHSRPVLDVTGVTRELRLQTLVHAEASVNCQRHSVCVQWRFGLFTIRARN